MPPRTPPPDDHSEGGWSDPGPANATHRDTSDVSDSADVQGRYALGALLGRGGMGVVHAARDTSLGRDVALKELQPELATDPRAAARLAREAAITSRLDHPGIVAVHDVGRLPDGRPFYTMRLVRGQTLAQVAADAPSGGARRQLVRHVLAAAEAVAAAHEQGIVHRDLKPANVLVGPHGETQVADWGLATRVAVAYPDAVEVHDPAGVRRLDAHGASLLDVAFSADGRTVAAVGLDPVVRVWNADTGALLGLLPGHEERVVSAEFLPGGDLVTASWDKSARLWSLAALSAPVPELAEAVAAAWGRAPEPGAGD